MVSRMTLVNVLRPLAAKYELQLCSLCQNSSLSFCWRMGGFSSLRALATEQISRSSPSWGREILRHVNVAKFLSSKCLYLVTWVGDRVLIKSDCWFSGLLIFGGVGGIKTWYSLFELNLHLLP